MQDASVRQALRVPSRTAPLLRSAVAKRSEFPCSVRRLRIYSCMRGDCANPRACKEVNTVSARRRHLRCRCGMDCSFQEPLY